VLLIAGGPAERAGIKINDRILAVDGEAIPAGAGVAETGKRITAHIRKLKAGSALTLVVAQPGDSGRTVSLMPETICAFPVDLNRASAVNAQTDGKKIAMFMGLMRAEPEPRRVQFVIAHELAHAILRHPQKSLRNSLISGGAVLGTVAATAGWIADTAVSATGKKPPVSYQSRGAALATYPYGRDFEREADYVGLYALTRAGIDTTGVENLFTTFARESPTGTWLSLSHPSSPERWLAVRATQEEIITKQRTGAPLLPNGWPTQEKSHANPKH
jgi:Zn-dependent protease with chaperone function